MFAAVQTPQERRRSLDDIGEIDSDTDEEERDVITVRDRQFRGYGIGGAGNISTFPGSLPLGARARGLTVFQGDRRKWSTSHRGG